MIEYKLKHNCCFCGEPFIHIVFNRGFKVIGDETYIVVHESNKHTMCPYCDLLCYQKQWRSGLGDFIYILVPRLDEIKNENR